MLIKTIPEKIIYPNIDTFGKYILKNKNQISHRSFAYHFSKLEQDYLNRQEEDLFCKESNELADNLLKEKELDFAGIIMSVLCKIKESQPQALEYFAKKGYNISETNGDIVHMMARLNDLRKTYIGCKERLYDYIQVLYKQEKCLKKLAKHYPETTATFRSVNREIAPRENYEQMLGYVQTEIGKLTRKKHPHDALRKLLSAQEIFTKHKNRESLKYIQRLIRETETAIKTSNDNV